jgi:hypothetical protein
MFIRGHVMAKIVPGWVWIARLPSEYVEPVIAANGLVRKGDALFTPRGIPIGEAVYSGGTNTHIISLVEMAGVQGGSRVVAWWAKPRVAGHIFTEGHSLESGAILTPDEVVCDSCNGAIIIRPVPVVDSYALCAECFVRTGLTFPGIVRPYIPVAILPTSADWVESVERDLKQITQRWETELAGQILCLTYYRMESEWYEGKSPLRVHAVQFDPETMTLQPAELCMAGAMPEEFVQ